MSTILRLIWLNRGLQSLFREKNLKAKQLKWAHSFELQHRTQGFTWTRRPSNPRPHPKPTQGLFQVSAFRLRKYILFGSPCCRSCPACWVEYFVSARARDTAGEWQHSSTPPVFIGWQTRVPWSRDQSAASGSSHVVVTTWLCVIHTPSRLPFSIENLDHLFVSFLFQNSLHT